MNIKPEDLTISLHPERKVGGWHVGTGPSGIMIMHNPTQIGVCVNSERIQHQNKEKALVMLEILLELK